MFFEGFLLGLGAAVPIGPINIIIINEALKSYKKAVAVGFGAMSADITYLLLILYGLTHFLQDENLLHVLSTVGGLFLIYFAFVIFKGRKQTISRKKPSKEKTLFAKYLKGYFLTLLNPYTILFWLSITTYSTSTDSISLTLFGLMSALILWTTVMPYVIFTQRELIIQKLSFTFAITSSIILLLFGITLLLK